MKEGPHETTGRCAIQSTIPLVIQCSGNKKFHSNKLSCAPRRHRSSTSLKGWTTQQLILTTTLSFPSSLSPALTSLRLTFNLTQESLSPQPLSGKRMKAALVVACYTLTLSYEQVCGSVGSHTHLRRRMERMSSQYTHTHTHKRETANKRKHVHATLVKHVGS